MMASKVMELIRAASFGDIEEILRLEAEGVSANTADYDGLTPLHLAACENQIAVIEHLIEKDINLEPKDRWGNTPLDDAIKFKNKEIKELLEQTIKDQRKVLSY